MYLFNIFHKNTFSCTFCKYNDKQKGNKLNECSSPEPVIIATLFARVIYKNF